MARLGRDETVVLRSPNGSHCAFLASERGATVVAACLRNARSVAAWLNGTTRDVAVIACGERWSDGSLRPSLEDHLAAGAVLAHLDGEPSPEARAAAALWNSTEPTAPDLVRACVSGQELVARGWSDDLEFAVEVHASATVPVLTDGAFVDAARSYSLAVDGGEQGQRWRQRFQ